MKKSAKKPKDVTVSAADLKEHFRKLGVPVYEYETDEEADAMALAHMKALMEKRGKRHQ
jgi:hypothetical protein